MPKTKVRGPDHDVNIQVGIFIGCDWTLSDIAKHLGVSVAAISQRKKRRENRQVIERVSGYVRVAVSKYVQARVHEQENDIAERKKKILEKGYKTLEKTLDAGLVPDAEVQPIHLKAAEMGIERTEGKPLDRRAILELTGADVRGREIDGGDLEDILAEVARINEMRKQTLALPAFTEAETIE